MQLLITRYIMHCRLPHPQCTCCFTRLLHESRLQTLRRPSRYIYQIIEEKHNYPYTATTEMFNGYMRKVINKRIRTCSHCIPMAILSQVVFPLVAMVALGWLLIIVGVSLEIAL